MTRVSEISPGTAVTIFATTEPCVAHRYHRPEPTYQELHHVVPKAWQQFWSPPTRLPAARAREALADTEPYLWDRRTAALCATGHRNVHFWLVRAMKAWPSITAPDAMRAVWHLVVANGRKDGHRIVPHEIEIARLGMERWVERGGDLLALAQAGLYGEA